MIFYGSERSSCFMFTISPYFRLDFLTTPEEGCISSLMPGKEHRGLSLGSSTQRSDSLGVSWLTGKGKVTFVSPGATCLFPRASHLCGCMPTLRLEEPEQPQHPLVKKMLDEQREPAPLLDSPTYDFSLFAAQVF